MPRAHRGATCGLAALFLLAAAPLACAQQQRPYIGYVYPAGAQLGTKVTVLVGGQYLDGVRGVHVTGSRVQGRVVHYVNPPDRGRLNQLRQKLREYKEQRGPVPRSTQGGDRKLGARERAAQQARQRFLRGLGIDGISAEEFAEVCKQLRITAFTLQDYIELARKVRDPKQQPNEQIAETVTLELEVAKDAEAGLYDFRLVTERGLTPPLRFELQALREVCEREPNDVTPMRELGALPCILNGQIQPGEVDRFAFNAKKGMHLVAVAKARVLVPYLADAVPGWFQATLTLFGPDGERVAFVDDFEFDPDPVLNCVIPADGTYTLEIRDAIYRGRDDFVYRIAIGEIPFVTAIFPLGATRGERPELRLYGHNLPQATLRPGPSPRDEERGCLRVTRHAAASNVVPFAWTDGPELLEQDLRQASRDSSDHPLLPRPALVSGRIAKPGEVDVYEFDGLAGEELVVEITARRLRSPLDSHVEIRNAKGQTIAQGDDFVDRAEGMLTHHADSYVRFRVPAAGRHRLLVRDTRGHGSLAHAYRLRLSRPAPDFALRLVPSDLRIAPGTAAKVTVHVLRHEGMDGEIELELEDAPEWILSGARIPAGAEQLTFTITAPPNVQGELATLRLVGRAKIDGKLVTRPAVPAEDRMQAFLWRQLVPADEFLVALRGAPRGQASPHFARTQPLTLRRGTKTSVRLEGAPRRLAQNLRLALDGGPPGLSVGQIRPRSGNTLEIELVCTKDTPAGLEGNLIFEVQLLRQRGPKGKERTERVPIGCLPALPFTVR